MEFNDEDIIRLALQGNEKGFRLMLEKYETIVFNFALRMVKNRDDAQEIAQDTFLRSFRYLHTYRAECKLASWLLKITYTQSLNFLRKRKIEIISTDDDLRPITLPDVGVPSRAFELEKEEDKELIINAIKKLSPEDAAIITLFYLMEQKISEICITMELQESNAKTKLSRARNRLKNIIEKEFEQLIR